MLPARLYHGSANKHALKSAAFGKAAMTRADLIFLRTDTGGMRVLVMLVGDPLPRICLVDKFALNVGWKCHHTENGIFSLARIETTELDDYGGIRPPGIGKSVGFLLRPVQCSEFRLIAAGIPVEVEITFSATS